MVDQLSQWVRCVLVVVLAFPTGLAGSAGAKSADSPDLRMRESVLSAIRQDGFAGVATVSRNDTVTLPFSSQAARELVYYQTRQGGFTKDEQGNAAFEVVDHPREWKAFVNSRTGKVYRLFGFTSGHDFAPLVRDLGLKPDATDAESLARVFIELVFGTRARIVENVFEVRRYVEDAVYVAIESHELPRFVETWLKRSAAPLSEHLSPVRVIAKNHGFVIELTAAKDTSPLGLQPRVEIHRLQLTVASDGALAVARDDLVTTAQAAVNSDLE